MPIVRKLSPDEVRDIENKGKGQRKLVEEQYDVFLHEYSAGDYGEAVLEPNENRLTVRNRLKAAARRRNLSLNFRRTRDNVIRFQVESSMDAPQLPPLAPAVKKSGRKKKNA